MTWEHLDVNRPHLVYILLGAFTSLFMLCSSVIKERLYIGEATVATIFGIIFGPHCADLINPHTWGNVDQITLEFSRIVLVVQCFAVGVELPRAYMEKHWKSVVFLLVPVMTFGWLVTSLFIWATMYGSLNWLDSLCVAACVTATDPVLASSVVGKGKFAKRVPKHLRDLLSAESGCNDGMAFPFIYLSIYLIRYRPDASEVSFHWFCYTILYECIFGAVYGVIVGYLARRAIRYAHEKDLIDRESFLVFYFVLALFCAGSGSILGIDDLLVGFACGVGFSNDGWFLEKTEEAHVSNVIDLLINLAFFVYFGTIIPWDLYSSAIIGTSPWRLVVIALLVIFFRRIPVMLALKPLIPDIKTWREALFAGHFGPIGVGALFVAILARAELETESTTPLAVLPPSDFEHANIIELIWPITTFLVITSIIVHGSSIAVFTLGKHINTLTINMSYTQGHEDGYSWMERLPRIQSRSKSSMAKDDSDEYDEKDAEDRGNNFVASLPRNFLRRQKEPDIPHIPSRKQGSRKKRWDSGLGPGGPVSQSAISPTPLSHPDGISSPERTDSDTLAVHSEDSPDQSIRKEDSKMSSDDIPDVEVYEEGHNTIVEDEEGAVLAVLDSRGETVHERHEHAADKVKDMIRDGRIKTKHKRRESHPASEHQNMSETDQYNDLGGFPAEENEQKSSMRRKFSAWGLAREKGTESSEKKPPPRKSGPAHAFRFGRTIIIEDEDGEVIQKYDIPDEKEKTEKKERKQSVAGVERPSNRLQRMGTWLGLNPEESENGESSKAAEAAADPKHDDGIRFTVDGDTRRMSKIEFIKQIQSLDPRYRPEATEEENDTTNPARDQTIESSRKGEAKRREANESDTNEAVETEDGDVLTALTKVETQKDRPARDDGLHLVDSADIPTHAVTRDLKRYSIGVETPAQRRRRQLGQSEASSRPPPPSQTGSSRQTPTKRTTVEDGETPAERRRREAALGMSKEDTDSEEEESIPRQPAPGATSQAPRQGIRFMDQPPTPKSSNRETKVRSRFRR